MKRLHPNVNRVAALTALAVSLGVAGCQNPSGGMVNPFLAPHRVPPPATRALAPGEAQPYYPGDPLPVMHSGIAPPSGEGNGLAWSASGGGASSTSNSPEPRALVFSDEPTIVIPDDGDSLRFALPMPVENLSQNRLGEGDSPIFPHRLGKIGTVPDGSGIGSEPATPILASAAPAAQVPAPPAAAASMMGAVPASYNAPALGPDVSAPIASPWRSPQVAGWSTPPGHAAQPTFDQPGVAQPVVPAAPAYGPPSPPLVADTNTMDVRLRVVASPPPESAPSSTPRIRLPDYATVPPTVSSSDGFRPRSSMR